MRRKIPQPLGFLVHQSLQGVVGQLVQLYDRGGCVQVLQQRGGLLLLQVEEEGAGQLS